MTIILVFTMCVFALCILKGKEARNSGITNSQKYYDEYH